jgi:hypothetical protein
MRLGFIVFAAVLFVCTEGVAQTRFTLDPAQSMIMTGKGPGQDATINPYFGEDCYAVVRNIGKREFSIRVQQQGRIIMEIPIQSGEVKRVKLLKGHELYLDPNKDGVAKAEVDYEKLKQN